MLELTCARLDVTQETCPLASFSYHRRGAFHDGLWVMTASLDLRTQVWSDGAWHEVLDKPAGQRAFGGSRVWEISALVAGPSGLRAVGNRGELYAWTGADWEWSRGPDEVFKKPRENAQVVWDAAGERLVMWGGSGSSGAPTNETFVYRANTWRRLKASGKAEVDVALAKRYVFVHPLLVYDAALARVVRVGYHESFVLAGDRWQPCAAAELSKLVGERDRAIAHDASSGETLVIDLAKRVVVRFDLDRCAAVARFELPALVVTFSQALDHRAFEDTWAYDAATRTLHLQNPKHGPDRFALDLGPAFDAAAALGPRHSRM